MAQGRGDRGQGHSRLRRAGAGGGSGADALFARLDALDQLDQLDQSAGARQAAAADLLARWAERVRAGMWNDDLAALVAQAEALERTLDGGGLQERKGQHP